MGFSIGRLLGGLAPIIGGIFGGPVGALIGGAVSTAFAPTSTPSQVGPTAGLFDLPQPAGVFPSALTLAPGKLKAHDILRMLKQDTGARWTVKQVKDMIRVCGIEATAQATGLTATSVCIVGTHPIHRRGRGISAADMRRTRSTIRKVHTIQHELKALAGPARRHHHHRARAS